MTIPSDINFTSVSTKAIKFDRAIGHNQTESVTVKIRENEPHHDLYDALNAFALWAVDIMDLGHSWNQSEVQSVDAGYENIDEKPILSIRSIAMYRESLDGEIPIKRSVKMPKICADDIPNELIDLLEKLWDEAWLYVSGIKSAQASLFEIDRTRSPLLAANQNPIEVAPKLELIEA